MFRQRPIWLACAVLLGLFALVAVSERTYLMRYIAFEGDPLTLPLSWYDPLEPVPGNKTDDLPVAAAGERTIAQHALDQAAAYAEGQKSQSLIIVHKGVIQTEHYWNGAERGTIFNPQSMSKSVLAMLMGIAIADGAIESVADPIGKYIGEWRDDPRGEATVQDALWMAAGLEQIATSYEVSFLDRGSRYNFGEDFNGMIFDLEQVDPPGTTFDYNNEETNLLGIVIERATGRRYADYLSEKLWRPLGLADATMFLDRPGGAVMKSCCIFSRPYDWAKLGQLVLNKGTWSGTQIVSADWIREMTVPSPLADHYGYLVWLGSGFILPGDFTPPKALGLRAPEGFVSDDMVTFLGYGGQRVWISAADDLVIVRGTTEWAPEWVESAIPNIIVRALHPDTAP
jgi:CubicO group peptidase (beta-lactamase class C family)